ncbi:helix-turn-helix domain-containing protein [Nocardioides lianchengensis]|uniref:Helix-turn-helix n=1 Tax=Nocardioides lianchengensis TaxID=1045774 RepID=A0A1G6L8B5_9ACTN|nr:helix-turn-helix transcriptional regulator [Nocardioides lianchengensis]NYG12649.1 transcriptional regulator with XRE-family HTH domain [Nocardioides lianchengensis]SDC39441.1 Helix-turn-helix [Nocardioides lianchengensis]
MANTTALADLTGPTTATHIERSAGSLVRLARAKVGLTQVELAERAHVPQSTISRIESGRTQPSLVLLGQLLAGAGLELRMTLAPFDDHDRVLDRRAAADPARQESAETALDAFLDDLRNG